MKVILAQDSHATTWNDFVTTQNLHHTFDWAWRDILSSVFGHTPYYFLALDSAEKVTGVLPLFHVKSALFGNSLISLPYLNGGGVFSNSDETISELLSKAIQLSKQKNVKYLELRERKSPAFLDTFEKAGPFAERSHKAAMLLPLDSNPDVVFQKFESKLRSQIRRPTKDGVTVQNVRGDVATPELVTNFYSVFAENMRDLGTPVYPKSLFEKTISAFGSRARVIVCYSERTPIAAGITIQSSGTNSTSTEIPWASSLREYNKLSPNMLLYWSAIESACRDSADSFDFGRSSIDSGPYRFKKQWGASPQVLHWQYFSPQNIIPDINPKSGKFDFMVRCWQQLPLGIANTLGPWLTKSLP